MTDNYSPKVVEWFLTSSCSFSCKHCIVKTASGINVSDIDISNHLDNFRDLDAVVLSGGEPTLVPNLADTVRSIKSLDVHVQIITNGYTWNERLQTDLIGAGLDFVWFSLDGTQKIHDSIRRSGSFAKIMQAIRMLENTGLNWGIQSVVMKPNIGSFTELVELLRQIKPRHWLLSRGISGRPSVDCTDYEIYELLEGTDFPYFTTLSDTMLPGSSGICPASSGSSFYYRNDKIKSGYFLREHLNENTVNTSSWMCPLIPVYTQKKSSKIATAAAILAASTIMINCAGQKTSGGKTDTPETPKTRNEQPTHNSMKITDIRGPEGEPMKKSQKTPPPELNPDMMPPCCLSHILVPSCKCH
ncbi:MAG: radical SAM protein [Deltaproteobacteria bacterium]|nr:radical SAM protein [Deltaproteobacteria bacterium]